MVRSFSFLLALLLSLSMLTGCRRSRQDMWDDTRTCGRQMMQGFRSLSGNRYDSRAVRSRDEFMPAGGNAGYPRYAPLPNECRPDELAMVEYGMPLTSDSYDDNRMPNIEAFRDATSRDAWGNTFRPIRFPYNSDLIKGNEHIATVRNAVGYLKSHPRAAVIIEGHCDERGAEAYNLTLGLRRAHAVRAAFIREGVNSGQLQVISYGKEKPVDCSHNEDAWSKNRRVEFKIYER